MNAFDDKNDAVTMDELHDRLVDHALREVLGKESPPDLSERILEMRPQLAAVSGVAAPAKRFGRSRWFAVAVAAALVLCAVPLIYSTRPDSPDVAKSAEKLNRVGNQSPAVDRYSSPKSQLSGQDHQYHFTEDGQYHTVRGPRDSLVQAPAAAMSLDVNSDNDGLAAVPPASEPVHLTSQAPIQPVPSGNIGLQGLIKETYGSRDDKSGPADGATLPTFTADLDVPFRQGSFGISGPRSGLGVAVNGDAGLSQEGLSQELVSNGLDGLSAGEGRVSLFAFGDAERSSVRLRRGAAPVQMLVTPGIIIQEEEFERPGIVAGGLREDKDTELGTGPGLSGDQYARIFENPFIKTVDGDAVSTFSIDVDTASYTNVRQFLMQLGRLPPPDAVRIEELVNYFEYDYAGPAGAPLQPPAEPGADEDSASATDFSDPRVILGPVGSPQPHDTNSSTVPVSAGGTPEETSDSAPFAAHVEVAGCPWAAEHRLVRIGVKGREMARDKRPQSNLVFLVDVSGSMNEPSKLPLVVQGLERLTRELGENDRVAIVVYASSEGLVLPSTPGTKQQEILAALGKLQAGGSTAGGAGIQLAYQIAEDNFIEGGVNRVILCTDGDFNVGVTSTAELQRLVEQKAKDTKVFLSVLGFGRGNLNDAMMEAISNRGNGNYFYVDNRAEAKRVLVEQMTGTLVTIAKDVKIQVEFNPRQVAGYRLLGYENRMLRTEDFNDDKKDAGEIGAGHTVTALYEVVPAGKDVAVGAVDELKYQPKAAAAEAASPEAASSEVASPEAIEKEMLTLKMRYKAPDGDVSEKLEWPVTDDGKSFGGASTDFQFAASVVGFGLMLRDSQFKGNLTLAAVEELAQGGVGEDDHGYRKEFLEMVRKAKELRHE